jgi:DNA polymerase-3 subunit epsilon
MKKEELVKARNESILMSREILDHKDDFIILDTETTGLGKKDVIIQIGIIDLDGNTLLDSFVKPTKLTRVPEEASAIHGIVINQLNDAPTFKEIYPKFTEVISKKRILIYNADFDSRLIVQTSVQDGFKLKDFKSFCMMKAYSQFIGEWNDYHQDFKFQKLPSGDHSAIGDCMATLEVIKKMANSEITEIPKTSWAFWKK